MFGADHDEAKAVLSDAIDNLRATAEWLGVVGRWHDLAALVSALWLYLSQEAPAEGVAWLRARPRCRRRDRPAGAVRRALVGGLGGIISGAFEEAMALHERAQALVRAASRPP